MLTEWELENKIEDFLFWSRNDHNLNTETKWLIKAVRCIMDNTPEDRNNFDTYY